MTPEIQSPYVHGRTCGDCALCCKLPHIPVLDKPANSWCQHCDSRKGCSAYETRPTMCREFDCLYLTDPGIGEEWYPAKTRMLLTLKQDGGLLQLVAMVDTSRPTIWREQPYYAQFKAWAEHYIVIIIIGARKIVVFTDHDQDLGEVPPHMAIDFIGTHTPEGLRKTARLRALNE